MILTIQSCVGGVVRKIICLIIWLFEDSDDLNNDLENLEVGFPRLVRQLFKHNETVLSFLLNVGVCYFLLEIAVKWCLWVRIRNINVHLHFITFPLCASWSNNNECDLLDKFEVVHQNLVDAPDLLLRHYQLRAFRAPPFVVAMDLVVRD